MPSGIYIRKLETLEELKQRFWSKVDKIRTSKGCLEWKTRCNNGNYGQLRVNNKTILAHRLIYQLAFGEIPDGLDVCHTCDNRKCVEITHLYLDTHKGNMQDCVNKNRQAKGEQAGNSKLTNEKVLKIRELYLTGNYSQRQLAKIFSVCQSSIGTIVRGDIWKHI